MLPGDSVAAAYRDACLAELAALKPGNVHAFAGGHGMTVAQFEASARVSAPVMGNPSLTVGARILDATQRTRQVVDCNTNLGIVLLCAPLAQAALSSREGGLQERLRHVLARLDVTDAEQAFAAIRLAQPGGLGTVPENDVRQPATATLAAAMAAAMERDAVARQYATGFADVFEIGVAELQAGLRRWPGTNWATTAAYLAFLARLPDSHIARKFGVERAMEVRAMAQPFEDMLRAARDPEDIAAALQAFDADLKSVGLNPGTSADLAVASLFTLRLQEREIGP
ncbi:MAG: triphosphoribosyl-dephospho-CoA synthase [Dongiaceae bacterium]